MEAAHEDAEIIFGTVIDESLKDSVKVTVIATGLGEASAQKGEPLPVATTETRTQVQVPVNAPVAAAPAAEVAPMQALPQAHIETVAPVAAPVYQQPVQQQAAPQPTVAPPRPNAAMLAATGLEPKMGPMPREALDLRDGPTVSDLSAMANGNMGTGAEGGELARARAIAQRLGITNLTDDEYDVPTYLRRQQERDF
jgi:cell division protein FtsZ